MTKANNLVVDLGGTLVRTALADADGQLHGRKEEDTLADGGPDAVIDQMVRMINASLKEAGASKDQIGCLAVGSPGPLNSYTGVVIDPPNLPGWVDIPLKSRLESQLGFSTYVENDANAAALGEFRFGAGTGHQNLVYLTVSTGIGGGVVNEGHLMRGTSGMAGEIGHMTIDRNGPRCKCGNIGCLEILASGTAIARQFREGLAAGNRSMVTDWLNGVQPTAADVAKGAQKGDPLAKAVFTEAAEAVGTGVVNCIHIFNPDVIVIGGGVAKAGELFFGPIRRTVDEYALPPMKADVEIVPAKLGRDVGLVGSAAVALEREGL